MYPLPELEPGARVDRWRVVERLGVGGQGTVYRVEDSENPGDFYALKLAWSPHSPRAEREVALLMTRAAHPGVARFHGCARWPHPRDRVLGFLMDWVPGRPLHLWTETGDVTFRQLLRVGGEVARTLDALHSRGVIHRDLKPEHIVLRESDGQPILLDFGVGWFEGATPLTTGPLLPATPHLLSPEAVRFLWGSPQRPGQHYAFHPTDDLYALGVCLYRTATGHYPFPEWLPLDLLQYAIVHQAPLAPSELNPRVPRALSDVIVRLLAKEPQARYPSGAAVHDALVAVSQTMAAWDMPVFDCDEETPRRIRRPERPPWTWNARRTRSPHEAEWRVPWPWRLGMAAAVLWMLLPGSPVPGEALVLTEATAPWTTDARVSPAPKHGSEPQPVPNQKRRPCTARLEMEYSGACWIPHQERPPHCPPPTVAYEEHCLLPVEASRSLPVSAKGAAPKER